MKIHIKTLVGTTLTLEVLPSDSIQGVRKRIREAWGAPPDQQNIRYNGVVLVDNHPQQSRRPATLADYNLRDGATLNFVLRGRGRTGRRRVLPDTKVWNEIPVPAPSKPPARLPQREFPAPARKKLFLDSDDDDDLPPLRVLTTSDLRKREPMKDLKQGEKQTKLEAEQQKASEEYRAQNLMKAAVLSLALDDEEEESDDSDAPKKKKRKKKLKKADEEDEGKESPVVKKEKKKKIVVDSSSDEESSGEKSREAQKTKAPSPAPKLFDEFFDESMANFDLSDKETGALVKLAALSEQMTRAVETDNSESTKEEDDDDMPSLNKASSELPLSLEDSEEEVDEVLSEQDEEREAPAPPAWNFMAGFSYGESSNEDYDDGGRPEVDAFGNRYDTDDDMTSRDTYDEEDKHDRGSDGSSSFFDEQQLAQHQQQTILRERQQRKLQAEEEEEAILYYQSRAACLCYCVIALVVVYVTTIIALYFLWKKDNVAASTEAPSTTPLPSPSQSNTERLIGWQLALPLTSIVLLLLLGFACCWAYRRLHLKPKVKQQVVTNRGLGVEREPNFVSLDLEQGPDVESSTTPPEYIEQGNEAQATTSKDHPTLLASDDFPSTFDDRVAEDTPATGSNSKALLGVSVAWLKYGLLREVRESGLDESATIYDLESLHEEGRSIIRKKGQQVVCPLDGRIGAAYVHSLEQDQVGPASIMLSYSWKYSIGDIVDTLMDYCNAQHLNPQQTYVWMCCLCNNQHRVAENIRLGKVVPFQVFRRIFRSRVIGIGHLLAMMSPWREPKYITRLWCIFELYTASLQNDDIKVSIVMPPGEKRDMAKTIGLKGGNGIDQLYRTLGNTRVEHADASQEEDKANLLKMIEQGPGFRALNVRVNDLLRAWVKQSTLEVVKSLIASRNAPNRSKGAGDQFLDRGVLISSTMVLTSPKKGACAAASCGGVRIDEGCFSSGDDNGSFVSGSFSGSLRSGEQDEGFFESGSYRAGSLSHYEEDDGKEVDSEIRTTANKPTTDLDLTDHEFADFLSSSGVLLQKIGEQQKAQECHEMALNTYVSVGKSEGQASSYNNLGALLQSQGDLDGAIECHKKALLLQEESVAAAEEEPTTCRQRATSLNAFASVLLEKGDCEGALAKVRNALAILEHDPKCPEAAAAHEVEGLVTFTQANSMHRKALELSQEALKTKEEILGMYHPETAKSYHQIGQLLFRTRTDENSDLALDFFQQAHAIREAILGPDHPDTMESLAKVEEVLWSTEEGNQSGGFGLEKMPSMAMVPAY
ncbi:Polyubiquitin (Fragment) [Seminavis robusta]|uniref:Polyubiquitin n=1 Tax=Seminavis robusta TaxID=568900 RepID=A0A9N8D5R4_9STRA